MKTSDKPIVIEQLFNAPPSTLWYAITVCDEMRKWFFDNIPEFKPIAGFETSFNIQVGNRLFPHVWRLTEVISNQKIVYHWSYTGYPGSALVTFKLSKVGTQTLLKLTNTVIENFPDNIPEFKRESAVIGWQYFIQEKLVEYINRL